MMKQLLVRILANPLVGALGRPVWGGNGVIFTLHRVVERPEETLMPGISVTADFLAETLRLVRRSGFEILSLEEVVASLLAGEKRRFVCFTFDDGYLDNLSLALPIFRSFGAPFTVFMVASTVEGGISREGAVEQFLLERDRGSLPHPAFPGGISLANRQEKIETFARIGAVCWRDKAFESSLPEMLKSEGSDPVAATRSRFLGIEEARLLAADPLCEPGSHCLTHRSMGELPEDEMRYEIGESRKRLERITAQPVRFLAYPFGSEGDCGTREFAAAEAAGYRGAVTTRRGNIFPGHRSHLYALPRVGLSLVPHAHTLHFVRANLSGARNAFMNRGRRMVSL